MAIDITKIKNKELNEFVMSNTDRYLEYLDHPVEVADYIKNLTFEEMVEIIDNMLFDDDITIALKVLLAELKKSKYNIITEDVPDRNIEIVEKSIEPVLNQIINCCFESYKYGFTVCNMNSVFEDSLYKIKSVQSLSPKYFRFTPEGYPYLIEELYLGQRVIPYGSILEIDKYPTAYKFFVHRNGYKAGSFYGESEVIKAYYLWSMKNLDFQEWILFLKKIAIPSFIALFDAGESQEIVEQRATALAQALMAIKGGTGGAMANVREVVTLQPQASAHESFSKMQDVMSKKIKTLISGSFLHSDVATTGAHNVSGIHQETMRDRAFSIITEIQETINSHIIPAMINLNNGDLNNLPKIEFFFKDKATWDQIKDSLQAGIPLKKDVLIEDYNIPIADDDEEETNIIQIEKESQTLSLNSKSQFFFQKKKQKTF